MKISIWMAGTAFAMLSVSPVLAQVGVGGAVGGTAGAVGGASAVPTIPGTVIPDTTADAARMTNGSTSALGSAASHGTTGVDASAKKSKHGKHKDAAGMSTTTSATTDTTAGTGANAGTTAGGATTATDAGVGVSTSGSSTDMSTSGSANMGTSTTPGGR